MNEHTHNTQTTDPALDALLDEAIGPATVEVPDGLSARLVSVTQPMLAKATAADGRCEGRPVLARIGMRWGMALAAGVALAVGVGLWFNGSTTSPVPGNGNGSGNTAGGQVAAGGETVSVERIQQDLAMLAAFQPADAEMELLALDLQVTDTDEQVAAGDAAGLEFLNDSLSTSWDSF